MYKCHIFFFIYLTYIYNIYNLLIVNVNKFWMKLLKSKNWDIIISKRQIPELKFISMINRMSLHRRNDFRLQISNFVILQAMKQQGWLSQLVRRIQAKASLYKYRSSSRVKLEQSANYESTITTMPRFNVTVSSEGDRGMRVVFEDNWNFLRNWIWNYHELLWVSQCF